MLNYLFSYGTLQKKEVQQALFERTLNGRPDLLKGYKVSTIEIQDPIFLAKGEEPFQKTLLFTGDENDVIRVTSFELTDTELLMADDYEPAGYKRVIVQPDSGSEAWVYLLLVSNVEE